MNRIQFDFDIMPGIYEIQSSPSNEVNVQSLNGENEQPKRESDQTDKLNEILLKSFLQHINNRPNNMSSPSSEPAEQQSEESDGDWN